MKTSQDAKFYGISAKLDKFSNENEPLVLQFTVKHEQNIDCGGGYIKLYSDDIDQKNLHGDSPYLIMFGEDKLHIFYNVCVSVTNVLKWPVKMMWPFILMIVEIIK